MNDLYDIVYYLLKALLPDGQEKHDLMTAVQAMQAQANQPKPVDSVAEKKASTKDGSSK